MAAQSFVCVFGSFTTLLSLSMLLPFLPLYVQQLGVSSPAAVVQWSGVAFGATFFGTAMTAPLWGRLADRYGRKPMLIVRRRHGHRDVDDRRRA